MLPYHSSHPSTFPLTQPHGFVLSLLGMSIVIALIISGTSAQADSPARPPELSQFTAASHVLGSLPNVVPYYQWHTFMGSEGDDWGHSLAVDGSGNVYVTGYSPTTWNGPEGQPPLNAHAGDSDIVVLKLNSNGSYQWHTFLGGEEVDWGHSLALDGSGNVYVTGISRDTWNGPGGQAPLNAHAGNDDIVVVKLNSNGAYQWHTFMGAGDVDEGHSLAVDGSGNVYTAGISRDTWNGPGGQAPLNVYAGNGDIVVLKLNSSGVYQWHTFLGSGDGDVGDGLAVDGSGNVYVTGNSPTTWNGPGGQLPLDAHAGGLDIVVLKLNSNGAYQWHTFMGSWHTDKGDGIAVDGSENVYVTGRSRTTWNGPGGQTPLKAYAGYYDLVVLKLNSSGAYQWHTFMGAGDVDEGHGLAVDGSGNVYVTGSSQASWNGPGGQAPLNAHAENRDIVVVELNSSGAYQWHTFMGGGDFDEGFSLAADGNDNLYVAGISRITWNGPGGQAPLNPHAAGWWDIVVLRWGDVSSVPTPPEYPVSPPPRDLGDDDDDDSPTPTPVPLPDQVFECWPWQLILPPLGVPHASSECLPSLGTPLPASSTFRYLGHSTEVTIKDASGAPVTQFNPPLKVCFRYRQSELDAVAGDPANFLIQTFYNGTWESLPTMPESDPSPSVLGRACAPVDHLTLFALFAQDGGEETPAAEVTSGAAGAGVVEGSPLASVKYLPETGVWPGNRWWLAGLLVSVVVGVGLWVLQRWQSRD